MHQNQTYMPKADLAGGVRVAGLEQPRKRVWSIHSTNAPPQPGITMSDEARRTGTYEQGAATRTLRIDVDNRADTCQMDCPAEANDLMTTRHKIRNQPNITCMLKQTYKRHLQG